MAGRMSRRGLEEQAVFDRVVAVDEIRQAGAHDRQHAVLETAFGRAGADMRHLVRFPMRVFLPVEQVARVGEGRHPASVLQPRVPADMVDMQMGA